jgi:hypothetical protein
MQRCASIKERKEFGRRKMRARQAAVVENIVPETHAQSALPREARETFVNAALELKELMASVKGAWCQHPHVEAVCFENRRSWAPSGLARQQPDGGVSEGFNGSIQRRVARDLKLHELKVFIVSLLDEIDCATTL